MPDDHREHHKDKRKHHHHTPSDIQSVVIKTEPPSPEPRRYSARDESPISPHHRSRVKIKQEANRPRSPKVDRKHRLQTPQVISEDPPRRRPRIHSPVIIKEDKNTSRYPGHGDRRNPEARVRPEFGKSGLLKNSQVSNIVKERANFGLSGKLAEDTNTYKGVVIKYNEPADARKPTEHWRLYAFKGNKNLPILHIHRQSGFLIGRDRKIADIPMDHPSISKQHAVLQYRFVQGATRLYLIDLESANGTYLNNNRIEPRRYYELLEKDVIKFGFSSREYVVMTADTKSDNEDNSP